MRRVHGLWADPVCVRVPASVAFPSNVGQTILREWSDRDGESQGQDDRVAGF